MSDELEPPISQCVRVFCPRVVAPPPGPGFTACFAYRDEKARPARLQISIEELRKRKDDLARAFLEAWERYERRSFSLEAARGRIEIGARPIIVGIVNATPDSFYAGSRSRNTEAAIARGVEMLERGADWLDIGGESTRPGATPVDAQEEMRRVLPVLAALRQATDAPLSIDTLKAEVAAAALDAGADIVNDVSGLDHDPEMLPLLAGRPGAVVLNHMRGTPQTMQEYPSYEDPVAEIVEELRQRVDRCLRAGISSSRILLDPGIGFGKRPQDNLAILRRLHEFRSLGLPLFLGVSRKSFVGKILGERPPEGRLWGSAAAVTAAVTGGAKLLRVHDPAEMADAARVAAAIAEGEA